MTRPATNSLQTMLLLSMKSNINLSQITSRSNFKTIRSKVKAKDSSKAKIKVMSKRSLQCLRAVQQSQLRNSQMLQCPLP